MWIAGAIFIVVGVVLFFLQKYQREKLHSIRLANAMQAADIHKLAQTVQQEIGSGSWKDYVKLSGSIECAHPLTSELKQVPCVYYSMQVTREYEETVTRTDSEGRQTRETERGSEQVSSNSQSTPFLLNDGTSTIRVNPTGANIETVSVLDEFRSEPRDGLLSFGNFSLALGNMGLHGGRRTLGYRYRESILPLDRRVFILAAVGDTTGEIALQKPTESGRKFLISLKSEEQVMGDAAKSAQILLFVMIACWVIGPILVIAGLVR
jgi:E3 Ubiquitin ligase